MKLYEITSNLASLIKEYIVQFSISKNSDYEFGSGDFDEICTEPGNCSMVSNHLAKWLESNGIKAKTLVGYHAKNKTWAKNAHVTPLSDEDAHTVVLVNDTVIDLTARQFDKNQKFPKIIPLAIFKSEWEKTD